MVQSLVASGRCFAQVSCWIVLELRKSGGVKDVSSGHGMMTLSNRELVILSSFVQFDDLRAEQSVAASQSICVDSNIFAHATRTRPAITKMQRDCAIRLAGDDADGSLDRTVLRL